MLSLLVLTFRLPFISTSVAPLPRLRILTFALPVELSPPANAVAEPPIDPELNVIFDTTSFISVDAIKSRSTLLMIVRGVALFSVDFFKYEPVTTTSSICSSAQVGKTKATAAAIDIAIVSSLFNETFNILFPLL